MNFKVTTNEWRIGHPLPTSSPSDAYYVKLANLIADYFRFSHLDSSWDEFERRESAIRITYYFEDVISGLGFWEAFVKKHKEMYGKYLPFYDVDETSYFTDEINHEDICFLVWTSVQQYCDDMFINPENPEITRLATSIYSLLDKEFEKAPINHRLVEEMYHDRWFNDFFMLKEWCYDLYATSYLLADEAHFDREEEQGEELASLFKGISPEALSYAASSVLCFSEKVGPLALTAVEWGQCLLKNRGMEAEAQALSNFQLLPYTAYLLKESNKDTLTVESLEGESYLIDRNSFNNLTDDVLTCKVLVASIALYNSQHWQVNGMTTWLVDDEIFLTMREKRQSRKSGVKIVYDRLLKENSGHPILYFSNCDELNQWMRQNIINNDSYECPDCYEDVEEVALFVDSNTDISLLPYGAAGIKDEHNPYYNCDVGKKEALSLLTSSDLISKEMLHYLLDNRMLPDACTNSLQGPERGRQLIQENMDFIARHFRRHRY